MSYDPLHVLVGCGGILAGAFAHRLKPSARLALLATLAPVFGYVLAGLDRRPEAPLQLAGSCTVFFFGPAVLGYALSVAIRLRRVGLAWCAAGLATVLAAPVFWFIFVVADNLSRAGVM